MLKEKTRVEEENFQNPLDQGDKSQELMLENAKRASKLIEKIKNKQTKFVNEKHFDIYMALKSYLDSGNDVRKKIQEKYFGVNFNELEKQLEFEDHWHENIFKKTVVIFTPLGFIMAFLKILKPPMILIGLLISLGISLISSSKKDFDDVFCIKNDFSDPISLSLISVYNKQTLQKDEIEELKSFLSERDFISIFGDNKTEISVKYGDEALRRILNEVIYKYDQKDREDVIRSIYYN